MPGVGDGATRWGFVAGFFDAGAVTGAATGVTLAGTDFLADTLGALTAGACAELVANCTAGRVTFDALFTQLSGSSEHRDVADAAGASSAQDASANNSWSGRVRFTWASEQDAPGTRIDRLYRLKGWKRWIFARLRRRDGPAEPVGAQSVP